MLPVAYMRLSPVCLFCEQHWECHTLAEMTVAVNGVGC